MFLPARLRLESPKFISIPSFFIGSYWKGAHARGLSLSLPIVGGLHLQITFREEHPPRKMRAKANWLLHVLIYSHRGLWLEEDRNLLCPAAAEGNRTFFTAPQHTLVTRESHVQSKPSQIARTNKQKPCFSLHFLLSEYCGYFPSQHLSQVLLMMPNLRTSKYDRPTDNMI